MISRERATRTQPGHLAPGLHAEAWKLIAGGSGRGLVCRTFFDPDRAEPPHPFQERTFRAMNRE